MTAEQNIWLRLLEKWADADDKKPPKEEKNWGEADPRGPFFSTQWEREDYERRQRGEPELGR